MATPASPLTESQQHQLDDLGRQLLPMLERLKELLSTLLFSTGCNNFHRSRLKREEELYQIIDQHRMILSLFVTDTLCHVLTSPCGQNPNFLIPFVTLAETYTPFIAYQFNKDAVAVPSSPLVSYIPSLPALNRPQHSQGTRSTFSPPPPFDPFPSFQ